MSVSVVEAAPIMSMALSPDGQHLLVNLASHAIHLWPLAPLLRQLDGLHAGHLAPGQRSPAHPAYHGHSTPGNTQYTRAGCLRARLCHRCDACIASWIVSMQVSCRHML